MKMVSMGAIIIVGMGIFLLTGVVFSQQNPVTVTQGEVASSVTGTDSKKTNENVTVSLSDKFNQTVQMQIQVDQKVELSNLELVISGPDWQMPE